MMIDRQEIAQYEDDTLATDSKKVKPIDQQMIAQYKYDRLTRDSVIWWR